MKISVVTPTYNRLSFLQQALASVWAQTYSNYELIVVDDGSDDGTSEYLESLGDRIKLIRQRRRGPSAARNAGVQQASGDYLAFLDSDDVWPPWTLDTYYELIRLHKPSLVCGAVVEFDGRLPNIEHTKTVAEHFSDFFKAADSYQFVGCGTLAVKKSVFDLVGGFDEDLTVAEDHDFLLRAGIQPGFVRIQSPMTVAYRRHMENVSTSVFALVSARKQAPRL